MVGTVVAGVEVGCLVDVDGFVGVVVDFVAEVVDFVVEVVGLVVVVVDF